jgi:hypothetical protein
MAPVRRIKALTERVIEQALAPQEHQGSLLQAAAGVAG